MPPAASSATLARLTLTFLIIALNATAATFPLPIPTRPTSFPLSRPTKIGEVVAWGTNDSGQLAVPPNLTNVVAISAGPAHAVALKSDGNVIAWGKNQNGEINVPAGLSSVVAITCGYSHNLALRSDGSVVAWGSNFSGESQSPSNSRFVGIGAGSGYSVGIKQDGGLTIWGNQGAMSTSTEATNIAFVACGAQSPVSVRADGALVLWSGERSQLSRNLSGIVALSTTKDFFTRTIALRADGTLVPSADWFFDIPLGLRAVAIAVAPYHALAINGDGTVSVWKTSIDDPGTVNYVLASSVLNVPPRIRTAIAVAAGDFFCVALALPRPPIPTTASASAQIVNGFIVGLNIIDGGEGYDVPPTVTITGGGGSGATATAQISRGVVTNFTMISAGSGYTSQPTFTIDPPPFLPKLSIAPSRVNVVLQVVPGKRYQLESSDDLPNFSPIGSPFTAPSNTITNEFTLSETGQFFRIQEVP
jgi:hypothetical protein